MTTAAEPRFGARGQVASQVRDEAVTAVLSRCKAMMRGGVHPAHVAGQLRASYGRLATLAAAVEVIDDEQHDPVPFDVVGYVDVADVQQFSSIEPVRTAERPFVPLTPPRSRTYTAVTPTHSRRTRRG